MKRHIIANLWLLLLTLLVCSVLYPAVLWVIGQTVFTQNANGSLVEVDGKVVGSVLIAQPFTKDEFFWPRPSSASYNGAASGASNWGASNYLLRDRVARAIAPLAKYKSGTKKGQLVGTDIEAWFAEKEKATPISEPGIVARWADDHSTLAQNWVKADKLNADYVISWKARHAAEVDAWKKDNPDISNPKSEDLAVIFFKSYSKEYRGTWPVINERKTADGKTERFVEPGKTGSDIRAVFFDMWRQDNPNIELVEIPADMVMTSGSGLDPHITLQNALYQLDRVAAKRAEMTKRDLVQVKKDIEALLHEKAEAPLRGLVGVELVNVLEVNLALSSRFSP